MYPWVSEGSVRKYHRAVAELTKAKQPVTEEAVKEIYVRNGGLVVGDTSTILGVPEGHALIEVHTQPEVLEKNVRGRKK